MLDNTFDKFTLVVGTKLCQETSLIRKFFYIFQVKIKIPSNNKPGRFVCHLCPKEYVFKQKLSEHLKNKHDFEKVLFCPEKDCVSVFKIMTDYNKHMKRDHQWKSQCEICDKVFKGPQNKYIHKRIHKQNENEEQKIKVGDAKTYLVRNSKDALGRHLRNVHQNTLRTRDNFKEYLKSSYYFCDICHKAFPTYSNLKDHVADLHNQIEALQCEFCEQVFESRKGLQDHTNSNHNSAIEKCIHCAKWFSKASMVRHNCQKVSKIENKLKQRLLTSYELKNKCQFCPKAFGSENKLRMHLKLSCKEFKNRIELLKYGKIHSLLEIVI